MKQLLYSDPLYNTMDVGTGDLSATAYTATGSGSYEFMPNGQTQSQVAAQQLQHFNLMTRAQAVATPTPVPTPVSVPNIVASIVPSFAPSVAAPATTTAPSVTTVAPVTTPSTTGAGGANSPATSTNEQRLIDAFSSMFGTGASTAPALAPQLFSPTDAGGSGAVAPASASNSMIGYIVLAVVALGGFLAYRHFRKAA